MFWNYIFIENNLRENDRKWYGFLEKKKRDKSMGLRFFIWKIKVV
jgi:hypothetical protein